MIILGTDSANERKRYIAMPPFIGLPNTRNEGIILDIGFAIERRHYIVTPHLIGRADTENDPRNDVNKSTHTYMLSCRILTRVGNVGDGLDKANKQQRSPKKLKNTAMKIRATYGVFIT